MCNCIDKVNALMADRNTQITLPWFGPQRPFVETMKVDEKKRGKPVRMFATFCPFCGVAYPPDESAFEPSNTAAGGAST